MKLFKVFILFASLFVIPAISAAADKDELIFEEDIPKLKFLELHGYFRVRGDIFYRLDLGTFNWVDSSYTSRIFPPISGRSGGSPNNPATPDQKPMGNSDTLGSANMRFRLEPVLNISEDIKILSQIDLLDNLILGSTPEAYQGTTGLNEYYPLPMFSQSQVAPHKGYNSYSDSITVKRVWAEVMTPFGQLRFGRMPSHWGLGVLVNDGSCFDCDGGSTADRIAFVTKIFGHYIVPGIDFVSEGANTKLISPVTDYPLEQYYVPIDADQRDDVTQYLLAVVKKYTREEERELLENGKYVLSYGIYNVFRNQAYDYPKYYSEGQIPDSYQDIAFRKSQIYIGSPWIKFVMNRLHLESEFDFIIGNLGDATNPEPDYPMGAKDVDKDIEIFQWGGVIKGDYKFLSNESLKVGLEMGIASGDDAPGWGLQPLQKPATIVIRDANGKIIKQFDSYGSSPFGPKQFGDFEFVDNDKKWVVKDRNITNFRFNPDYRIDMILWREVIGQLTDAWYIKPSIDYTIVEGFNAGLDIIYSQAIYDESTPGDGKALGLEFDLHLKYESDDNFIAGLDYGFLIPFSGLDNLGADRIKGKTDNLPQNQDLSAETAQRIRGYLGIKF